jgi:hypothetical protein
MCAQLSGWIYLGYLCNASTCQDELFDIHYITIHPYYSVYSVRIVKLYIINRKEIVSRLYTLGLAEM